MSVCHSCDERRSRVWFTISQRPSQIFKTAQGTISDVKKARPYAVFEMLIFFGYSSTNPEHFRRDSSGASLVHDPKEPSQNFKTARGMISDVKKARPYAVLK